MENSIECQAEASIAWDIQQGFVSSWHRWISFSLIDLHVRKAFELMAREAA